MALVKITFDSASVTSKQDADVNHFLACFQNGKLPNVLGGLTASSFNNYISFTSGYVQVYGRRVLVEDGSRVLISLDGSAYGYVIIKFNLSNNTVSLEKKETTTRYPTLVQDNLMNGGTTYELPLARYTKTSSSLTLDTSYEMPVINNAQGIANVTETICNNRMDLRYGSVYQASGVNTYGSTWKFETITSANAAGGIASVRVGTCNVLFVTDAIINSGGIVNYNDNGVAKTLSCSLTSSGLLIQASDGSEPKYVRVVK